MTFYKQYAAVLSCLLLFGGKHVCADTTNLDSAFADWTSVLSTTNLSDGSILFEYTAQTSSKQTEGAVLSMAFSPRFNCTAVISVRAAARSAFSQAVPTALVTLDDETLTFQTLVDRDGPYDVLSLISIDDRLVELRQTMDDATKFSTVFIPGAIGDTATSSDSDQEAATDADASDSILFSLLGSRKTTQAVESRCMAHQPVVFSHQ